MFHIFCLHSLQYYALKISTVLVSLKSNLWFIHSVEFLLSIWILFLWSYLGNVLRERAGWISSSLHMLTFTQGCFWISENSYLSVLSAPIFISARDCLISAIPLHLPMEFLLCCFLCNSFIEVVLTYNKHIYLNCTINWVLPHDHSEKQSPKSIHWM